MRVGVVGLGHIGGSILVRIGSCVEVVGYDADSSERRYMREAWDACVEESLGPVVEECDLLVVCVPTPELVSVLAEVNDLRAGWQPLSVIEVSSVKCLPVQRYPNLNILSTHPMAGKEGSGARSLDPGIFNGATWLFVISGEESDDVVGRGLALATKWCGSYVLGVSQQMHNNVIAAVSELPHVSALALARVAIESSGPDAVRAVAAGSYRGATRVATGNEQRVAELLVPNRSALEPLVRDMANRLWEFAHLLGESSLPNEIVEEAIRVWVSEGNKSALASSRGDLVVLSYGHRVTRELALELAALGHAGKLVSDVAMAKTGEWEFVIGSFA